MPYYTVKVELLVKAEDAETARDIAENHIDDALTHSKELQDYIILDSEEQYV
jgi:hypothetical protein